jgi:hypothetical protein
MGQLVIFCMLGESHLLEGMPPVKTFTEPKVLRPGPIIIPEATPPRAPALSPLLMGTVVPKLWAGIMDMKCLSEVVGGRAMGKVAIFG